MIERIWQNCFLYRMVSALQGFYQHSAIAAFWRMMAYAGERSRVRAMYTRVLGRPFDCLGSVYARSLRSLNRGLYQFAQTLRWRDSLTGKCISGLARCLSNSVIGRLWSLAGTKRLFLIVFALFLPIDVALRTYCPIALVGSLWDDAFLLLGFLYTFKTRASRLRSPAVTPLDGAMLLFIGLGFFLMCAVSPDVGIAIAGYRVVVEFMLWFWVLSRLAETESDILTILAALSVMATAIALHGIYQYIIGVPIPASWVSAAEMGVRTRAFSIIGSPNILGDLMVLCAPVTVSFAYRTDKLAHKMLAWCCTFLQCLCCLVTFTRGAWLGMAVAVILFGLLVDRRILAYAFLAAGVLVFVPAVANRLTFLMSGDFAKANANNGRADRWDMGFYLLRRSNPWLGFGLGRFGGAVAMQNQIIERQRYFYLDNYYIKTMVEMGYLGLGGFVFLLLSLMQNGLRSIFRVRADRAQYAPACGILSGMVGVLAHCFSENIFEVPYMTAYFWGLAAILMVIGFGPRMEAK